jgi:hypothetical protein
MKNKYAAKSIGALVLALAMAGTVALTGPPGQRDDCSSIANPHGKIYGKSLTDWLSIYWRWYYSGGQSRVGKVQLMPLPDDNWSGSGTLDDPAIGVGQLEITLPRGTPIVLPLIAWTAEQRPDGSQDERMNNAVFIEAAHPVLMIDGETVVSDVNKDEFYVHPTKFNPPVSYFGEPGHYVLYFQGIGVVVEPLPPGNHVIRLYESFIVQEGDYPGPFGLIYVNSWFVTVN